MAHFKEWGTYTSCQSSNGKDLSGLHHGEVNDLPNFVHARADGYSHEMWEAHKKLTQNKRGIVPPSLRKTAQTPEGCGFCEVMDWIPRAGSQFEVTQKLETPVIYFYSHKEIEARVTVDFPKGIVTEVYPETSSMFPAIGQVTATANGQASWNVTVHAPQVRLSIPEVAVGNIWEPSRRVSSNFVSNNNQENEKHIFYRGLGRFDGPVSVHSTHSHMVIKNNADEVVPAAWVLVNDGSSGKTISIGSIKPGKEVKIPLQNGRFDLSSAMPMDLYVLDAGVKLEIELVAAGLFPLEARAMVDTWSRHYFAGYGSRVLYIAPSSYPDTLLPLTITPAPKSQQRVLVGRIETILKAEEQEFEPIARRLVLGQYTPSQKSVRAKDQQYLKSLGRFAEPKVRAVLGNTIPSEILEAWILSELTYTD